MIEGSRDKARILASNVLREYENEMWFSGFSIELDEDKLEFFVKIRMRGEVSRLTLTRIRGIARRQGVKVVFEKTLKKEEKTLVVEIEESRHSETPLLKFSIDGEEIDRVYTTLNVVKRLKQVTKIKIEGE